MGIAASETQRLADLGLCVLAFAVPVCGVLLALYRLLRRDPKSAGGVLLATAFVSLGLAFSWRQFGTLEIASESGEEPLLVTSARAAPWATPWTVILRPQSVWYGVRLPATDLAGASLPRLHIGPADLSHARLARSTCGEMKARRANFRGADLAEAYLEGGDFRGADFRAARLRRARLGYADLRGADFRGADLTGASLGGARTEGARFDGACLFRVSAGALPLAWRARCRVLEIRRFGPHTGPLPPAGTSGSQLVTVVDQRRRPGTTDLRGADLSGLVDVHLDLHGCDLRGADLREAQLHSSNLAGCDLRGALISHAGFYDCDLRGADLRGTLCAAAMFHQSRLEGVRSDQPLPPPTGPR